MLRALSIAITGMSAQQLSITVISNNLANVSTAGFKKSIGEFQDLMYQTMKAPGAETESGTLPTGIQVGSGVKTVSVYQVFAQGDFQQTGHALDLAIEGEGFFQVTLPDGDTAYTRSGSFKLNQDGNIVTSEGYPMEPNLSVPSNAEVISISPEGIASVTTAGSTAPTQIGTVELARFINPAGLRSLGGTLYEPTEASGEATTGTAGQDGFGRILQGAVEGSNVNIAEEMVNMIVAQRAYEINAKAIQTSDEMLAVANNLKR